MMTDKRLITLLDMVIADMENDAKTFDGNPFTGKVVGTQFGNQGAAIAAIANAVKTIVEKGMNNDGIN